MSVESVVSAYVSGRFQIAELERGLERAMLRKAGRAHPVPPGWEPLPPCEHDWIEITSMGSAEHEYLCAKCSEQKIEGLIA